jgi:hypothetical protein
MLIPKTIIYDFSKLLKNGIAKNKIQYKLILIEHKM